MNNLSNPYNKLSVGLVGASGYSGSELLNLLSQHPQIGAITLFDRNTNEHTLNDCIIPIKSQPLDCIEQASQSLDLVFLATPASTSMDLAPLALQQGSHVIDLSGAFRLPAREYANWYQAPHSASEYLSSAIYGLSPYTNPQLNQTKQATLVANPGCYASCALMALLPLLQKNLIDPDNIIIDAKSGISGAGKASNPQLMFSEINENFYPYKIGQHQHTPEITGIAKQLSSSDINIILNTQLLPLSRGIAMTLYTKLNATLEQVQEAYQQAYANYPLVKFCSTQDSQSTRSLTELKNVARTPFTHIVYSKQSQWLCLFACLDNLLKGAASQAIENMNVLFDFPLATGLQTNQSIVKRVFPSC